MANILITTIQVKLEESFVKKFIWIVIINFCQSYHHWWFLAATWILLLYTVHFNKAAPVFFINKLFCAEVWYVFWLANFSPIIIQQYFHGIQGVRARGLIILCELELSAIIETIEKYIVWKN